jgi:phosphoglucosamine mutase
MVAEKTPLSALAQVMQRVPQVLESVMLPDRRPIEEMPGLTRQIKLTEERLGTDGRVLVRWSGTEPKLRLMVEGPDPKLLEVAVREMVDAARADLGVSQ